MVHSGQFTAEGGERGLALAQRLGVRSVAPEDELAWTAFLWTLRRDQAAATEGFYLALAEGWAVSSGPPAAAWAKRSIGPGCSQPLLCARIGRD
jgi:hypothetical protein